MHDRRVLYLGNGDGLWDDLNKCLLAEGLTASREPVSPGGLDAESLRRIDAVIVGPDASESTRLDVCREVRRVSTSSITVISKELDEADELRLAVAGACAICFLPIRPRVLAAQIANRIGRLQPDLSDRMLSFRGVNVYPGEHVVTVKYRALELTKTEFELLAHLMRNPRRVYTHDELSLWLWGDSWVADHHRLEAHVCRLRKKVIQAGGPTIIGSVRGVGYRLMSDMQVAESVS